MVFQCLLLRNRPQVSLPFTGSARRTRKTAVWGPSPDAVKIDLGRKHQLDIPRYSCVYILYITIEHYIYIYVLIYIYIYIIWSYSYGGHWCVEIIRPTFTDLTQFRQFLRHEMCAGVMIGDDWVCLLFGNLYGPFCHVLRWFYPRKYQT